MPEANVEVILEKLGIRIFNASQMYVIKILFTLFSQSEKSIIEIR